MADVEAFSLIGNSNSDVSFGDIPKSRATTSRVDIDSHKELVSVHRNVSEVNANTLVITMSISSSVVTSMMHALDHLAREAANLRHLFVLV
jgi:hypothetical protein